jgi:hypothetical protein
MSRFQKCFPRPVIVCPDELSNTTGILIAYDGSLPGGLCKCSHFSGSDSIESFRSCLSMQAMNWFPYAAPRKYLRFHRYHVDEARLLLDCVRQRF